MANKIIKYECISCKFTQDKDFMYCPECGTKQDYSFYVSSNEVIGWTKGGQECLLERFYEEARERGETGPIVTSISCNCPKCSPRC